MSLISTQFIGPKRPIEAGSIHLGVAQEIQAVLVELGEDPEEMIVAAGLDPRLFDDPDNLIPIKALGRLVLLSSAKTKCPHFGLLVGQKATLAALRLVGSLMKVSDTLGEALRALEGHLRVQNRGATVRLEVEGDVALLRYSLYEPGGVGAAHITDGAMATAVKAIRELCGSDWAPSEILLPHSAPEDLGPYHRFFRAPVRFDQEMGAIVFPKALLRRPLPSADPLLRLAIEQQLLQQESASAPDLKDELRRLLRTELTKTRCSAEQVAGLFTVHRRTLNRRLRAQGTDFKTLAGEVRFEIARQLLADTNMPLAAVSAVLDFSDPAAFSRAVHRWSGLSPSAWRAQHRNGSRKPARVRPVPRNGLSRD